MPKGSFVYVPVSDYYKIANQKVDLVTNFFSLGEMRREFHSVYMHSTLFKESKKVFNPKKIYGNTPNPTKL